MSSVHMKKGFGVLLGMAVLMMFARGEADAEARIIDGIVAVVDNKIIMDSDLKLKMVEFGTAGENRAAEKQVLELMIEDIVIEKVYRSMGFPPVSEEEAQEVSRKGNVSLPTAKSFLMKGALMDMMVRSRVVITENMIRNYYDAHADYKGRESVRLSQIIIRDDDEKVKQALRELESGASFDDTARKYSDSSGAGGSDIGWIAVDDLSDRVRKAVVGAALNETLGPVPMGNDMQVFYQVRERGIAGMRTLEETREEIHQTLVKKYQQEAFNHWLQRMMTQFFIGMYI